MATRSKSKPFRVCVIAACDRNGVIGVNGDLPWHCPEDLRHFRYMTVGRVILMGRRTAESLKKPLRDRVNVVLTRDRTWTKPGFHVVHDQRGIQRILKRFEQQEVWVIGGQDLYNRYVPMADVVHLTVLNTEVNTKDTDCVKYFPVNALKMHGGVHAQCTTDPNVVFWVFTPHRIQTGRAKPINAIVC